MPARRQTEGTGITARTVRNINTGEADFSEVARTWLEEHNAGVAARGAGYGHRTRHIVARAAAVLDEIEGPDRWWLLDVDEWTRRFNAQHPSVIEPEPDSNHDFARRIALLDHRVRQSIAAGNAAQAADYAVEMGFDWAQWRTKLSWERDALDGRATQERRIKGARKGAETKKAGVEDRDRRICSFVADQRSRGEKGVLNAAVERFNVSPSTVERAVKKFSVKG